MIDGNNIRYIPVYDGVSDTSGHKSVTWVYNSFEAQSLSGPFTATMYSLTFDDAKRHFEKIVREAGIDRVSLETRQHFGIEA